MLEPGCCSAVHRAGTNTDDRGHRLVTDNARGSRSSSRPATERRQPCCPFPQQQPGRARQSSTQGATGTSGLSRPIFSSPPRPSRSAHRDLLWFAFASHASCNLTRCLIRATHSHQETQGSADMREEIQHPALHGVAPSTTLSPSVAAGSPTRSLAGTLLTWYSEQKAQPLSRQCFTTHGTRHAPLRRPAANQVAASPPRSPRPRLAEGATP